MFEWNHLIFEKWKSLLLAKLRRRGKIKFKGNILDLKVFRARKKKAYWVENDFRTRRKRIKENYEGVGY